MANLENSETNEVETFFALHRRSARGEVLSPAEQLRLESGYAAQDRAEFEVLARTGALPSPAPDDSSALSLANAIASLQHHLESKLTALEAATRRIQELIEQNRDLRVEIERLRHEVARRAQLQAA